MPRSATESRKDKRRPKSSVQVTKPLPPDPEKEYIFRGRLTRAQWTDMLNQKDTDETVGEIMDELLSKVMDRCLKVDIEKQVIPFTVSWAESYLTQILEHQSLCIDEGEGPEESSKTEDSEPVPAISDAWAVGCVPVVNTTYQPHRPSQQEADIGQVPGQTEPRINPQCNVVAQTNSSPKQAEKETRPKLLVSDKHCKALRACPPPKADKKKRQQVNSPPKHVPGKLLPSLPCSKEKKDVAVESKSTGHSVSNHMTGSIHQDKNYQPIPKLDRLPRHWIVPQYEIVDKNCTKPNAKKPSGLSRPRRNMQNTEYTVTSPKPLTSNLVLSGPLRLDTMVLAKGVSLRDPEAVEMNPRKLNHPSTSTSTKLRPVQSDVAVPPLSVAQVTSGPPPRVIPLS